ncbi:MAG: hypothetical protein JF603_08340 [Acidobacteria bacterium]|nr:hypothetical protein [Acidobacteriota bacterium]
MQKRRVAVAHVIVAVVLLVIVVLLPVGLVSVVADLHSAKVAHHELTPRNDPEGVHADIYLEVVGLNEWEGTASIRVSAEQSCGRTCPWSDRYVFTSVFGDGNDIASSRPGSEIVELERTAPDVTKVIKLPVFGDPIRYPFDRYRLGLGIEIDRVQPDGSTTTLTRAQAHDYAWITLQSRIPRGTSSAPHAIPLDRVSPRVQPETMVTIQQLTFGRPAYLQILSLLLVLLVAAAACFAVFMRPLDQLVINSGALVLGVWGVRSILLGTSVPGLTEVDIALLIVILFLLVAIAFRTLWLIEADSPIRIIRRNAQPKADG